MNDVIFKDRLEWARKLEFQTNVVLWYHNNIPMLNMKNYGIRLFVIETGELPTKDIALQVGKHICEHINSYPTNNTKTTIDENSFFWIEEPAVWADIIGYVPAFEALKKKTEIPFDGKYDSF